MQVDGECEHKLLFLKGNQIQSLGWQQKVWLVRQQDTLMARIVV